MRFNISAQFAAKVADTMRHDDPWGMGLTFYVFRQDAPAFLDRRRRRVLSDPLAAKVALEELRAQVDLQRRRQALDAAEKPVGEVEVVTGLEPEPEPALARVSQSEMLLSAIDSGEMTLTDIYFMREREELEEAIDLLAGWAGEGAKDADSGQPIPCNRDNARALFTSEEIVSEGYGAGDFVGRALIRFIREASVVQEEGRAALLESAMGNSEPSSAGPGSGGDGLTH